MKSLETLHKLAVFHVEEKQKEVGQMLQVLAALEAERGQLDEDLVRSSDAAAAAGDVFLFQQAGLVSQRIRQRWTDMDILKAQIEALLVEKREELKELFAEQKRYEILLERAREAARKKMLADEQKGLDEAAGVRFGRG